MCFSYRGAPRGAPVGRGAPRGVAGRGAPPTGRGRAALPPPAPVASTVETAGYDEYGVGVSFIAENIFILHWVQDWFII